MTDERYVIQSKGEFKKFPYDKRNKFPKTGDLTMDIFETYLYVDEDLAEEDRNDMGLSDKDFEIKKYIFTVEEAK